MTNFRDFLIGALCVVIIALLVFPKKDKPKVETQEVQTENIYTVNDRIRDIQIDKDYDLAKQVTWELPVEVLKDVLYNVGADASYFDIIQEYELNINKYVKHAIENKIELPKLNVDSLSLNVIPKRSFTNDSIK